MSAVQHHYKQGDTVLTAQSLLIIATYYCRHHITAMIFKEVRTISTPKVFAGSKQRRAMPLIVCALGLPLVSTTVSAKPVHRKIGTHPQPSRAAEPPANVPAAARIALARGRQLATQGAAELAEDELRHAVSLAPNWIDAQRELARLYTKRQKWVLASAAWRTVLFLDRNDGAAQIALASVHQHLPFSEASQQIVHIGQSSENPLVGTRATSEQSPRLAQGTTAPSSAPTTPTGGTSTTTATPDANDSAAPATPGKAAPRNNATPNDAKPYHAPSGGTATPGSKASATGSNKHQATTAKAAMPKTATATATPTPAPTPNTPKSNPSAKTGTARHAPAANVAAPPVDITPVSKKRRAAAWPHVESATRLFQHHEYTAALDAYQRAYELDPNNPYAQPGIADTLLVLKRFKLAEQAYRRVLAVRPTEVKALRGLADSLTAQHRFAAAIPVYKQVAAKAPQDFASIFQLAQLLTWGKQYQAADPYYRQAITLQPHNASAWTSWGEALSYSNNERAADTFLHALALKPKGDTYLRAARGLADFYNAKGAYDKAVPQYRAVLGKEPRNLAALTGLGDALTFSSQGEAAVPYYERALDIEPKSQTAQLGLGRALVLTRHYGEGIPHIQRVLEKNPDNVEALRMLALAQSSLSASGNTAATSPALAAYDRLLNAVKDPGQQAEIWASIADLRSRQADVPGTLEAYSKAIQLAPDNTNIGLNYAQTLISQDKVSDAEPIVRDLVARDPNNVRGRVLQVVIESQLGHKERALALTKNLEGMQITNPQDALQLATALRNAGDAAGARQVLARLVAQLPEDSATALQVANAVRDGGEFDTSIKLYQQLLQREPNNTEAHANLGEVLVWQKQYDAAQKQVDFVLAHDPNNVQAQVLAGKIAIAEGRPIDAGSIVAKVLTTTPNNGPANDVAGAALSTQGKFLDAVERFRKALDANPGDLDARLGLARNLYYSKQVEPAISEYQKLVQLAPNDNQVKLELAKVYLDTNRLSDAEVLFNQVLESHKNVLPRTAEAPGQIEMRSNARVSPLMMQPAVAPRRGGRTFHTKVFLIQTQAATPASAPPTGTGGTATAAVATGGGANAAGANGAALGTPTNGGIAGDATTGNTQPVTNVPPLIGPDPAVADQTAALRGLGEVRRLQQRYPEAMDYFRQALKVDDTDTGARVGLAQSLRAQGDYVTALSEVERALATDDRNLQGRVLHAQLMGDTGKSDQAQQELDKLVGELQETTPLETYLTLAQSFDNLRNYDAALQLLGVARKTYPNEPAVAFQTAETQTFAKHWDAALQEYDQLIAANPHSTEAVLGKARVYNYSNRLEQAEPLYRQTLQLEPNNYNALRELADVLSRRGNWVDAIGLYRQAAQKNPNDLGTRVELARTLRYDRQFDEADTELTQVLGMDAKYAPAYTERGILRGQQGRYEPAIADLRQALSITPTDLNAQFGLAEVLGYAKNYDESISLYKSALEHDPNNEKGRTELGLVLAYATRYPEALNEFNAVLKQNPQNVSAQIGKADTLARSGHVPAAAALYQTVLRTDPQNRRAQLGLAEAYVYGKDYGGAIRLYDTLIAAEPNNVSYKIARARTLNYAGRSAQAIASLRPIVAGFPTNLEARMAMAEALTNSGERANQKLAIAQYETVLRMQPDNTDARLGLGRAYSYTGQYPQAANELQTILKTQPHNEAALFALAETERFAGHPFDAQASYKGVLAIDPNNQQAQEDLRIVRRDTASSLGVYARHYDDTNGVRLNVYGIGPTFHTRQGTIGITTETGNFSQNGAKLSRRATNLLLAHNFGAVQARLLLNRVNYSSAPSRNPYELLVQRAPNPRERYYAVAARREVLESLGAVRRGITAQEIGVGLERPVSERVDFAINFAHLKYTDDNTRDSFGTSLMYRLKSGTPTFRVGLGYSRDDTKFISPLYYTPQSFNVLSALADYTYNRDRLRYGLSLGVPLTNRNGSGGVYNNRAADTLFGHVNYDLTDLLELYLQGGIVRASNFRSNDINGGVNLRF